MLAALALAGVAAQAASEPSGVVAGDARVIDADILIVGGERVILWGVDAPERSQACSLNGRVWGCYDAARRALESLAGRGAVSCTLLGEADPFGRRHGLCLSGDEDLAAELVRAGLALAYTEQTTEYEALQFEAIGAGVGLWQPGVIFEEPWDWRRSNTPGGYR